MKYIPMNIHEGQLKYGNIKKPIIHRITGEQHPKTFKTERGCPFLIKINKKESTYNNQKKKSKKEKITCNNPEERKQEKEYHR